MILMFLQVLEILWDNIKEFSGAVKSNIGHLEGASGLAGLIKTVLSLEKGIIPPNTNFEKLNPKIDSKHLRIKVRTSATVDTGIITYHT